MTGVAGNEGFSRPVAVVRLNQGPLTVDIEATPAECLSVARRFGVVELKHLRASVAMTRDAVQGDVVLNGGIDATVVQLCVVTLEPFTARLVNGAPVIDNEADAADVECDVDGEDIEPLRSEVIDVGETVAQYLGLALEAHPRAPGAAISRDPLVDADQEASGPFAALSFLRSDQTRS